MKLGSIIKNKRGLWVVTQVDSNGELIDCEHIDDFIIENAVVVDLRGEHRTIKEIIEERKEHYLSNNEIIDG